MLLTKRRTGRRISLGVLFGGLSGSFYLWKTSSDSSERLYAVLMAGVSVPFSAWLWFRRYYNDLEALAEYRQEVDAHNVKVCLSRFASVSNILKVVSVEYLREKTLKEVSATRNSINNNNNNPERATASALMTHFGPTILKTLINGNVLDRISDLVDRTERELASDGNKAKTFSDVWYSFNGHLPELFEMCGTAICVVRLCPPLRQLLAQEYYWIDEQGGPKLCAPYSTNARPQPGGVRGSVWHAIAAYGLWCVEYLSVSRSFLSAALVTSTEGHKGQLSALLSEAVTLHSNGLLPAAWIVQKFWSEQNARKYDLDDAEKHLKVSLWVSRDVIDVKDVRPMFREAAKTCLHVIPFAEKWSAVLPKHFDQVLDSTTRGAVHKAVKKWHDAQTENEAAVDSVKVDTAKRIKAIHKSRDKELGFLKNEAKDMSEEAVERRRKVIINQTSRDEQHVKEEEAAAIKSIKNRLEIDYDKIHSEFWQFLHVASRT